MSTQTKRVAHFATIDDDELALAIETFAYRVQPIYQLLGWEWKDVGIPSVKHLTYRMDSLINDLMTNQKVIYSECGGLLACRTCEGIDFGMFIRDR